MAKTRNKDYWVKQELVYREYEKCLDIDLAMTLVGLSNEEQDLILNDKELEARILILDASNKADMLIQLRELSKSAYNEGVRLAALKELGKTYYPKRFKDEGQSTRKQRTIQYEVVEPTP